MKPRARDRVGIAAAALLVGVLLAAAWSSWSISGGRAGSVGADPVAVTRHAESATDAATIERGAYLARLGNCAGCHTAAGGAAYAGGRGIATPFGTVFAGNLTPDETTGLGRWTAQDFWNALHHGRSRDGRALLPAFPYTEFTRITRSDSDALWAHLRRLPPVVRANPVHELRFPYNTSLAIAAWRAVYFEPGAFEPDPKQSALWNRGAYLANSVGHCAACHAPRDRWGGLGDTLSGGRMAGQGWWAPSLIDGSHDADQMVALLKTGQSTLGTAMGPMAEVVVQSTQHWSDADLRAIAEYLGSLPRPGTGGTPKPVPPTPLPERGRRLYADLCIHCHGEHGEGVAGVYPPLAGNPSVLQPDPVNLVHAVRHGGFAPATRSNPRPYGMPPHDLDDAAIAELLTYLRRSWGHEASAVSELQVLRAR